MMVFYSFNMVLLKEYGIQYGIQHGIIVQHGK